MTTDGVLIATCDGTTLENSLSRAFRMSRCDGIIVSGFSVFFCLLGRDNLFGFYGYGLLRFFHSFIHFFSSFFFISACRTMIKVRS